LHKLGRIGICLYRLDQLIDGFLILQWRNTAAKYWRSLLAFGANHIVH
jgi:hypothetical protein